VRSLKRQGLASDAETLAERLRALGHAARVLTSNGSHTGPSALRLAHHFVIVSGVGSDGPLVVEPSFREHFCIGTPYQTERYRQVLAAVPEELVAPHSQLAQMVRLVCTEMKFSFTATGNSVPPWRSAAALLSRWSAASGMFPRSQ
jgi:uncharacterized protein (TIGR01615 family)